MKLCIRHIITLIIASFISFTANADMSHPASSNFSDVFATTTDRYQYSGKEFDRMNGLDLYDFHVRKYDPVLGRFTTPDPLSEKYYHISPYAYCLNNPIKLIDPDGQDAQITIEDNTVTVKANIILTGNKATADLARIYKNDIMSKWGAVKVIKYNGSRYEVKWDVNVIVMGKNEVKDYNGINNYMEVIGIGNSSVKKSNDGVIRSEGRNGRSLKDDCPMAHEFGHMLGISDKYITDKNSMMYGQPISFKWAGDIMAEPTYNPVKITKGTLNILFKGALDKHLNPLRIIYRYMFNNPQTIEYRNEQNREKKR